MEQLDVVVTATWPDLKADGIAAAVADRDDMTLAAARVLTITEADALLGAIPPAFPYAVVIVGLNDDTADIAERWLAGRRRLAVVRVDVIDDLLQMAVRHVGLAALLMVLRDLVLHCTWRPEHHG